MMADYDEDELWNMLMPPKKVCSDLTPLSQHAHDSVNLSTLQPQLNSPAVGQNQPDHFSEAEHAPLHSQLSPELLQEIENATAAYLALENKDNSEYCSSSSEFEVDDDSSESSDDLSASEHDDVDTNDPPLPYVVPNLSVQHINKPSIAGKDVQQPILRSPPPSPPKSAPVQAAITNYFGITLNNGSTAKTTSITLPNAPALAPNRRALNSSMPSAAVAAAAPSRTPPKASNTTESHDTDLDPWSRKPPPVRDNCPFYKRIAGTTFIVDDFRYAYIMPKTKSFFLSHFHSDHYAGINQKFDRGTIYCSTITASLLINYLRVPAQYVCAIEFRTPTIIEGVEVTLYDANHCPGAAVLLFHFPGDSAVHLHTGDFRYDADCPDHKELVTTLRGKIGNLYLDTTYCDPQYTFPHQQVVISRVLDLLAPYAKDPKTLFVFGTYTIGKERMWLACAERFQLSFHVKSAKLRVLKCLEMDHILREMASADEAEARIHILPLGDLSLKKLEAYLDERALRYSRIIAVRPTGWTYATAPSKTPNNLITNYALSSSSKSATSKKTPKASTQGFVTHSSRKGAITLHSAPYSEHSSFNELCSFVRTLQPRWIIPTVNNRSREAVSNMVTLLRNSPASNM